MKRLEDRKTDENKKEKRASIGVFLSVAVLFLVIICGTELIGMRFGKHYGTIALVFVALLLSFLLYRKEIMDFFKKK